MIARKEFWSQNTARTKTSGQRMIARKECEFWSQKTALTKTAVRHQCQNCNTVMTKLPWSTLTKKGMMAVAIFHFFQILRSSCIFVILAHRYFLSGNFAFSYMAILLGSFCDLDGFSVFFLLLSLCVTTNNPTRYFKPQTPPPLCEFYKIIAMPMQHPVNTCKTTYSHKCTSQFP